MTLKRCILEGIQHLTETWLHFSVTIIVRSAICNGIMICLFMTLTQSRTNTQHTQKNKNLQDLCVFPGMLKQFSKKVININTNPYIKCKQM